MQTFYDLEHTFRSLNACIYYRISVSVWRIIKKILNDGRITLMHLQVVEWSFDMHKNLKMAKGIDLRQPARTAQADVGQYFSQCFKPPFHSSIIYLFRYLLAISHRGNAWLIYLNTRTDITSTRVVRASSWAGGRGFDPRPRQIKFFKTGSSGFPRWRSGLWELHYDWPTNVRIMDWLSTG